MNKAITDGVLLMPPEFAAGLDVWSSGNGTPGSDTYDGDPNAAFVPADADFGGCLELLKTNNTQSKLVFNKRYIDHPTCKEIIAAFIGIGICQISFRRKALRIRFI